MRHEGMELVVRGRGDVNPLYIRIGVALALSLVGFMAARRGSRARPRARASSCSRPRPSPGCSSTVTSLASSKLYLSYFWTFKMLKTSEIMHQNLIFTASDVDFHLQFLLSGIKSRAIGKINGVGLKELRTLKGDETLAKIINGTSTTTITTTTTTTTTVNGLSPRSKSSDHDDEGFLLSEFSDLVMKELRSNGRDLEITTTTSMPTRAEIKDVSAMEQEITKLRNLVWSLQEKERSLELQLLEYYGMQEQEAAVRELESQLKINSVEAKLYALKVESLQAENMRLLAKLSDYSRAVNELEAARVTIKLLKKKMKTDGEQAQEKIASLHQRLSALQCEEQEAKENEEMGRKFKRLKELEDETAELKRINSRLTDENSELATKLNSAQSSLSSVLKDEEADALKEINSLRESNEKLTKDIDQLQTDRYADVEELVYLRWVNACLRYELRNYQPLPGKTIARDLSKKLSPRSEEKAKQLILEYANCGGDQEKSLSSADFDYDYCLSSQASTGEAEDSSVVGISSSSKQSANTKKKKFLSKLKKLVLGKDSSNNKLSTADRAPIPRTLSAGSSGRRVSLSTSSIDDMIGRDSYGSFSSITTEELNNPGNQAYRMDGQADERCQNNEDSWSQVYSRQSSVDLEEEGKDQSYKRQAATPYRYEGMVSGEGNAGDFGTSDTTPEKADIMKFAVALQKTRGTCKVNGRSASFSG
ncbi:hypothetical protein Cni_G05601 [Canna indica]|uniref:Protein CHUP1, chloroplastic n=1 Tax=Canna indica TaxID=4628 RepID=A0AAQ3Q3W7_9LILI|nr:hypothetical protein Cni_G05601 [Canna indica]